MPGANVSSVEIESDTPSPSATGAEMVQAIASLLKNAFDASGNVDGVVLRFAARGRMVRIEVQDRGAGMSPDARRRAGEPFFTTKEPGRGLGLGLFLVRTFAERSGGTLEFDDTDGTTAILEVPALTRDVAGMTDARSLLIVDDDTPFRERLVRAMRDRGFETTGVADHPTAMDVARDGSPELALVDLQTAGRVGSGRRARSQGAGFVDRGRRAHRVRQHRDRGGEHEAWCGMLPDQARRRGPDRRGIRWDAAIRRDARSRRSLVSNGSTFNGSWRTALATSRTLLEYWVFIGGHFSANSASARHRADCAPTS